MTRTTQTTTTTSTHFTLPAILPTILTGLFILTACGGGALPNDASIAPDTQNDRCADNPLAEGCQADAGFLSVNLDEGIGNQEAEPSVAPPTPKPVVNAPVVKKTEPVLKELAKKKTPPTPAPITSVDTHDFAPKTSPSTQSAPAEQRSSSSASGEGGATGSSSHDTVSNGDGVANFDDWKNGFTPAIITTRNATPTNEFLEVSTWTHAINLNQFGYKSREGVKTPIRIPDLERDRVRTDSTITRNDLDRTGAVRADSLRMNLAQATFDGVAIGGDVADGIDFFTTHYIEVTGDLVYNRISPTELTTTGTTEDITHSRFHYAGILAGTDLGEPVDSAVGMATWNGSFRTYNTNAVDFQLTVTFGGEGERTISAFVKDTARSSEDNYYLIAGNYTAAGRITSGTVNWGTFSDIAQRTPTASRPTNGTLTGIIGKQGAVAVFISDANPKTPGGTAGGYAGGFVAAPSNIATGNTDATFSDWTRAIPTVTGGNNGFLAGGATGLIQTAITNVINLADCNAHNAQTEVVTITYTYHRPNPDLPTHETNEVTHVTSVTTRTPPPAELDCTGNHSGSLKLAGTKFGEVTDSGVAFVTEGISLTTLTSGKSFAGLLSGTDLGAPITSADQVGEWKGQFKSVGGYYFGGATRDDQYISTAVVDTDFTLTVTFGAVGGVDGSAGSIEAFAATHGIDRRFLLAGTYDANGVITGTVLAGLFNNDDKSNPSASINGVLTGLIGVDGAVGAFVSNADNYNYAGGFVASPRTPDVEHEVVFADWTRSFTTEPATTPTTGTPQSEFLQTTGSTLATGDLTARAGGAITVTTLDLNTATLRNNPLGDDARDGVAFYQGYINSDGAGYAGIFSTTDLGRPITAKDARAEWRGQFQVIESRKINTDFTLEITFGAVAGVDGSVGKVEAFVEQVAPGAAHHYVSGTFNNAGVIKGTATAGFFPNGRHSLGQSGGVHDGILTGLIGQEGAVGAFYAHTGVYAGGFVALPFVRVPTGTTTFWARNTRTATAGVYPTILPSATATLTKTGSEPNDDPQANFMLAGAAGLVLGADTKDGVTIPNDYNVNISQLFDGTDATSGFALEHAQSIADTTQFNLYVGILSGTDVGAPFTNANMPYASWTGRLRLESPQAQISFNQEVDFTVAFDGTDGTITTGTIDLGAGRQPANNLTIAGQFGANGVIYGTTTANLGSASENVTGTLSGLIGVDGAVAVFAGNDTATDGSYAGGFVARPTFFANYDNWLDSFDAPLPAAGRAAAGTDTQFLQSNEAGDGLDFGNVTLGSNGDIVTFGNLTIPGNNKHGVSFFRGSKGVGGSTTSRFFAGMLSGTNVGRPLAPHTDGPADATWKGKIQWIGFLGGVSFAGSSATLSRDFDLDVNYSLRTIQGFANMDAVGVAMNANNRHLLLNAGYNELGQFTNGTVQYGIFENSQGEADRTATRVAGPVSTINQVQYDKVFDGVLTGIIGQEGAVGVFINDIHSGSDYNFAGGFWAAPTE